MLHKKKGVLLLCNLFKIMLIVLRVCKEIGNCLEPDQIDPKHAVHMRIGPIPNSNLPESVSIDMILDSRHETTHSPLRIGLDRYTYIFLKKNSML